MGAPPQIASLGKRLRAWLQALQDVLRPEPEPVPVPVPVRKRR